MAAMRRKSLAIRIGRAVRKRRIALGIHQEVAAAELGVNVTQYRAIETGATSITVGTLQRLCLVLKMQMWELMREAERPPSRASDSTAPSRPR